MVTGSRIVEIRIIPYPPSLSRIAARIIDPAMGASTWALGSHRWTPYRGILTMNAIIQASHRMLLDHVWLIGEESSVIMVKFSVPIIFWIWIRAINRGIDPTRV